MSACVFIGPSLPISAAKAMAPTLIWLPPAEQGCIIDAVSRYSPSVIGIVDGFFRQHPSVWHKEILWALDQGIGVYGAASMGALRAAELDAFGMVGVGTIFESYRRGALPPFDGLCDDDEVAIAHGPAETGYVAVTDAMVNIRASLAAARENGILEPEHEAALLEIAKSLHFSERRYRRVLADAEKRDLPQAAMQALEAWLATGRIDQKRLDAEALVWRVKSAVESNAPPARHDFLFATTELFADALHEQVEQSAASTLDGDERAVLDALASDPARYREIRLEALLVQQLRPLDTFDAGRPDTTALKAHADRFRRRHRLFDRTQIDAWLHANRLDLAAFDTLLADDLRLYRRLEKANLPTVEGLMLDRLRAAGDYARFASLAKSISVASAIDSDPRRRE